MDLNRRNAALSICMLHVKCVAWCCHIALANNVFQHCNSNAFPRKFYIRYCLTPNIATKNTKSMLYDSFSFYRFPETNYPLMNDAERCHQTLDKQN